MTVLLALSRIFSSPDEQSYLIVVNRDLIARCTEAIPVLSDKGVVEGHGVATHLQLGVLNSAS